MTVVLGRLCTICAAREQKLVPAVNVASNAVGLQWYECKEHGSGDHSKVFGTGLLRIRLESAEEFFNRHFPEKAKR